VILKDNDAAIKRAGGNIPWLSFLSWDRLRAHDLFYGHSILVLESAVKHLNEFYAPGGHGGAPVAAASAAGSDD